MTTINTATNTITVTPCPSISVGNVSTTCTGSSYVYYTGSAASSVTASAYYQTEDYFDHDAQNKLGAILRNVPNSDAKQLLHLIFQEVSSPNSKLSLTKDIENAILSMGIDAL